MCFAFWAFTHLPLADASTIIFTNPVVTAILARLILKESFTRLEGLSACLCLFGVVFISQPTFIFGDSARAMDEELGDDRKKTLEFAGLGFTTHRWFGLLIAFMCSLFAASSFLTVRKMGSVRGHLLSLLASTAWSLNTSICRRKIRMLLCYGTE